jgi:GT2 family glycosyltransferase
MTTFSTLICTYNRSDMLEMALNALIDRTEEKPDQVVIVNGGDDRTDQIVRKYMDRRDIQVDLIRTVNLNLAASRNLGLVRCTGDIVSMTDDDAEVFPNWVTQMKKIHAQHPEAGCVGGAVIGADSQTSLLSRIADRAVFSSPPQPAYVRTIAGVNVSYKRSVLQAVGLQDETLFRGEDVDFNWRVKKLGYEIYYDPEIKVLHHHRPTLARLLGQFYMYGRAYYLVRCKWPEMYSVYPREMSRWKDLLKLIYFIVSTLSDPLISAAKMPSWIDRILTLPVSYALHIAWKSGIVIQKLGVDPSKNDA